MLREKLGPWREENENGWAMGKMVGEGQPTKCGHETNVISKKSPRGEKFCTKRP